ncbi:MAG: hypothetical protein K0R02_566 [Rickettsiaceae bacterium]|jgi:hypothetical protein|nr:hypothetical protein [Rickettsiaceae bacterium]
MNKSIFKENLSNPPYFDSIKHSNNNRYIAKKDDLFFVLERVTWQNIDFWKDYANHEYNISVKGMGIPHNISDPVHSFQKGLVYWNSDHVWIAYATKKNMSKADTTLNIDGDIEMCFTVMTNENVPFTTHMGIFRAAEFYQNGLPMHKNLAMELHSFAAKACQVAYGSVEYIKKEYMITQPVDQMREIMAKSLPKEAVYIGDHSERKRILDRKKLIENYKSNPDSINIEDFCKKLSITGSHRIFSKIKDIRDAHEDLDSYSDYSRYIKANIGFFDNDKNIRKELKELLKKFDNLDILPDNQRETIINFYEKWQANYIELLKAKIDKDLDSQEKWLESRYDLCFGNNSSIYMSPFEQQEDKFIIEKQSREKVIFNKPYFYSHEHLHLGLPTVIIDFDTLASLKQLEEFDNCQNKVLEEKKIEPTTPQSDEHESSVDDTAEPGLKPIEVFDFNFEEISCTGIVEQ